MSMIEINHVSKHFQLGQLPSLRERLRRIGTRISGRAPEVARPLKALDDIDFTVRAGEVVGIIGHNGAGKSTLLRIISRVTPPSKGFVRVRGTVSPLIEVGAGLVGDLSGRDNIYLNGAILGMSRAEIARRLDEIVAFSELERFLDTPVKRYSTGMAIRLAVSIGINVDADVLLLDEVLAVGDLAFQRKCFDRMESLFKSRGTTVIIVSHNVRQIERICERAILLDGGRLLNDGPVFEVCNQFYDLNDKRMHAQANAALRRFGRVESAGSFVLESLRLVNDTQTAIDEIPHGSTVTVELVGWAKKSLQRPMFTIGIHTTDFIYLAGARSETQMSLLDLPPGRFRMRCRIRDIPLLPGSYSLHLYVSEGVMATTIFNAENVTTFRVTSTVAERQRFTFRGFFPLQFAWSLPETIREP